MHEYNLRLIDLNMGFIEPIILSHYLVRWTWLRKPVNMENLRVKNCFFFLFQKKAFENVPIRIKAVPWPEENYLIGMPEHMIRIYEATYWLSDTLLI